MLKAKLKSRKGITGIDVTMTVIILTITITLAFLMSKNITKLNSQMYYNVRKGELRQKLLTDIETYGVERVIPKNTIPYKYEEQNTKISLNIKEITKVEEGKILKINIDDKEYYVPIVK